MSSHFVPDTGTNCELIEAVAAALVEPAAGLPGAATVGIAARVDAVLADYPHYVQPLREALDRVRISFRYPEPTANSPQSLLPVPVPVPVAADVAAALGDLERERPDLFAPLLEVVVGAWALSEPVWEVLGYEGQRDLDPAAHAIPEDLFEPLLARGPRWRQPPEVDR